MSSQTHCDDKIKVIMKTLNIRQRAMPFGLVILSLSDPSPASHYF